MSRPGVLDLAREGLAAELHRPGGIQVHGARIVGGQKRGGDGRAQAGLRGVLVQGLHKNAAILKIDAGAGKIVLRVLNVLLGFGLACVVLAPVSADRAAEGAEDALEALVIRFDGAGLAA
jgi:hypothetical protein